MKFFDGEISFFQRILGFNIQISTTAIISNFESYIFSEADWTTPIFTLGNVCLWAILFVFFNIFKNIFGCPNLSFKFAKPFLNFEVFK